MNNCAYYIIYHYKLSRLIYSEVQSDVADLRNSKEPTFLLKNICVIFRSKEYCRAC